MTRVIRFIHGQPTITAASSISPDSCSIALVPLLEANGKNFTPPTIKQIAIADTSVIVLETSKNLNVSVLLTAKKTAEKLNAGIKYGKKAKLETKFASLLLLFLLTA